ncbi:hypothetical protein [Alicyclobacillus sp. ALC3]|uniref:hypothetical protein n=1 Tax=Alicyclobacillus sp. ALC3 TaxID=2796143 RepID=UPI002378D7E1|nr:hypothetical protein [Alicyclobacillus sp. ALC3]WDL95150.1 hypothetical protein JC200_12010 [Alicyclobacillus sp. ALC3]
MTFTSMLAEYIGRVVDVTVTGGTVFSGTLTDVAVSYIQVQEPYGPYGPGLLLRIPTTNIEYVVVPQ